MENFLEIAGDIKESSVFKTNNKKIQNNNEIIKCVKSFHNLNLLHLERKPLTDVSYAIPFRHAFFEKSAENL